MSHVMINGSAVNTDNMLPKAYTFNGSNQLVTESFVGPDGHTYTKTYTYTGSNLTNESGWVKS